MNPNDIRCVEKADIRMEVINTKTVIKVDRQAQNNQGATHYVQYRRPLTPDRRFFFVELIKLDSGSNVVVGVAPQSMLEDARLGSKLLPGQAMDTVGYFSKSGLMFYNDKSNGNMMGHRCSTGSIF